ncbi:hypothetical protein R1sor_023405 [Riccia sorocarpa]|uniref:Vacuolar protein 8 n=1 Tax=Riccia sorocarpa TaxID=122646 RepID=A0ABD3GTJ6_9MARC
MTMVNTQDHLVDYTLASFTLPKAISVGKRYDLELEDCEAEDENWLEEGEFQPSVSTLAVFTLPAAIRSGDHGNLCVDECEDEENWLESEDGSRCSSATAPVSDSLSFSQRSLDLVSDGARDLLLLSSFCDGPFPEEIMEFLWSRMKVKNSNSIDVGAMVSFREELERQKWLDVKSHTILLWSIEGSKRTWTICSLQQQYVKDSLKIERKVLFKTLLNAFSARQRQAGAVGDKETISMSLCTLYFDKSLVGTSIRILGLSHSRYYEMRKIRAWIVHPLLWLLRNVNTKDWFGSSGIAMKVFLSYVSSDEDDHDKEAIRLLLALPSSRETTCWVLMIIALVTQKLLVTNEKYTAPYEQNRLKPLVDLVAGVDWAKSPEESAGWALGNIRSRDHHDVVMGALPGLVEGLVGSLAQISYPFIKICSLIILADLALESRYTVRRKIFEFPDALPALVELLSKEECYTVQMHAASVLESISLESSIARSICELPGIIKDLVDVIFRAKSRSLQAKVTGVLSIIAVGQDESLDSVRTQVLESPGVLNAVVKLLCETENRNIQSQAALLLAMLSTQDHQSASAWKKRLSTDETFCLRMADILLFNPEAFLQLVLLLCDEETAEVQAHAGRTLNNITSVCPKLRQELVQGVIPGYDNVIVDQLVKLLNNNRHPYGQIEAVRLLATIGDASDDHEFVIGIKLANEPKVLPKLAMLMDSKETPILPQLVTVLFYFTARAMHKESISMAPLEEAKEGLLNLLTEDQHTGSGRSPYISAYALTLLDPIKAGTLSLYSEDAFEGRADALAKLKMYPTTPEHDFAALDLAYSDWKHHPTLKQELSRNRSQSRSKKSSRRLSKRELGYPETDTELDEDTSSGGGSGRSTGKMRRHFPTLNVAREKLLSISRRLKSFRHRDTAVPTGGETPLWQPVRSLMRGGSFRNRKSKLGENNGLDSRSVSRTVSRNTSFQVRDSSASRNTSFQVRDSSVSRNTSFQVRDSSVSRNPSFQVWDSDEFTARSTGGNRGHSRAPSRLPSSKVLDFTDGDDFELSIPVSPYRLMEHESPTNNSLINVQYMQR